MLYPTWCFFAPKCFREAYLRDWLDERDELRARGTWAIVIWATLFSHLAMFAWAGSKERLLDLMGRVLTGRPKGPGAA